MEEQAQSPLVPRERRPAPTIYYRVRARYTGYTWGNEALWHEYPVLPVDSLDAARRQLAMAQTSIDHTDERIEWRKPGSINRPWRRLIEAED